MTEHEGTIQFAYDLAPEAPEAPEIAPETFQALKGWRSILHDLGLLGQSPDLYGGYAYGNLSVRTGQDSFIVTASQTSGATELVAEDLVSVTHVNFERFWVDAQGSQPPSSESLTHAMIYAADPKLEFIFHVHSTTLWQARAALNLPETPAEVPYGSPAMAEAVMGLMQKHLSRPLVFATAGHEDGIFAMGHHARDCGGLLVTYLAKARGVAIPNQTTDSANAPDG